MSRLIDADALINTLQELFDKREKEARFTGNRNVTVTWNDAIYHIKTAPTIEPIRCGDCKHWTEDGRCRILKEYIFNDDFFCVNAERKEGEADD